MSSRLEDRDIEIEKQYGVDHQLASDYVTFQISLWWFESIPYSKYKI